jgi:hypothetical protein
MIGNLFVPSSFLNTLSIVSRPNLTTSPLQNLQSLEDLQRLLLSNEWGIEQWKKWQDEIAQFIYQHQENRENLDQFLSNIILGMVEKDLPLALNFLAKALDLDCLSNLVRFKSQQEGGESFQNVFELANLRAPLCTLPKNQAIGEKFYGEWKRFRPIVVYFLPNLINLFLGAFNFLDSHKKFTTLWDKYLLLDIVYKFFAIPFFLVQVLQPIFGVTAKVYAIAAAIIVCGGILAACYQKWLKPLPDEIVNCINLDKQFERGDIDRTIGVTNVINQIIPALLTGSNILLIGKSGDGKSAITQHLIQLKHEKKLPPELLNKSNYEVDCGLLISNYTFGHSELINQIKSQIEGYENQILFHFDELDQLADNPSTFKVFKKRFLTDRPTPSFIATTTIDRLRIIEAVDTDGAFRRKVIPILVDGDNENQNRRMLQDWVNHKANDIPIQDAAIEKILELAKQENFLPLIGTPAKAIKLIEDAVGKCRWIYSKDFTLPELEIAKQEVQFMISRQSRNIINTPAEMQAYRVLKERIEDLERTEKETKEKILRIKNLLSQQLTLKENYFKLTHQLAKNFLENQQGSSSSSKLEDQKLYLLMCFYAVKAIKTSLQQRINDVRSDLPVQVDAPLIQKIFDTSVSLLTNPSLR